VPVLYHLIQLRCVAHSLLLTTNSGRGPHGVDTRVLTGRRSGICAIPLRNRVYDRVYDMCVQKARRTPASTLWSSCLLRL
jgi:predicted RNase H-like nuclease